MTITVFIAVIGAALLHAVWNAMVKGSGDKLFSLGAVMIGHVPMGVLALLFCPPPDLAALPYIFSSIALHTGYQIFLLKSYEKGDLTQVYPIARGSAPMIVALVSVLFLGVALAPIELVAIALIGCGIISLTFVRKQNGERNSQAAILALVTGCFIASYSLNDGMGARVAQSSLGFYSWVAIGNGVIFAIFIALKSPRTLEAIFKDRHLTWITGGGASFIAYAIVTWAFTQAPIAIVTALRETSIIFALIIGVVFLGEKLSLPKLISTFITLSGVVLLRFVSG